MAKVKLVAPDGGARIVPDLARFGLPELVEHGSVIDIPDELVGEGPKWRRIGKPEDDAHHPDNDPQAWRSDHHEVRVHAGHLEVHDLGHGLLAQVGVWELAGTKTKDAD